MKAVLPNFLDNGQILACNLKDLGKSDLLYIACFEDNLNGD